MRRAWVGLLLCAARAHAGPTTVTAEGGAEGDTNVARIDSKPGVGRVAAGVARLGAKLDHRGTIAGGTLALYFSGITRVIADAAASEESTALAIGDLRWMRALPGRPAALGFALSGADASAFGAQNPRTFRSIGADALVLLRGGDDRTLSLGFGVRGFQYKIDSDFNWIAPAATARLDVTLWEPAGGTRSVELSAFAGLEARAYNSTAAANACAPDEMPTDPRLCSAGTSILRRDRFHRRGAELTWTGRVVAAAGYQVSVIDSNSSGQSLVRHRINLGATTDFPWKLYGSALVILQFDQYLDGLIVQEDLQNQTFTTLDDENRSSLQLRLAREITETWSLESRAAIWRDLDRDPTTTFRRAIVYLGAVYAR
jgi:hypothetical protein